MHRPSLWQSCLTVMTNYWILWHSIEQTVTTPSCVSHMFDLIPVRRHILSHSLWCKDLCLRATLINSYNFDINNNISCFTFVVLKTECSVIIRSIQRPLSVHGLALRVARASAAMVCLFRITRALSFPWRIPIIRAILGLRNYKKCKYLMFPQMNLVRQGFIIYTYSRNPL